MHYILNPKSNVTVVITSCGRLDLLYRTLKSFFNFNSYPIAKIIIIDDSGIPNILQNLKAVHPLFELMDNEHNIGQILSIDRAYAMVETEYVFHLEDDWEFYRSGFIEASIEVLEKHPKCINLWLREQNDTNGHPHRNGVLNFNYRGQWHGFTFNPTLKRMSDYKKIGCYSKHTSFDKKNAWRSESKISTLYKRLGYHARISPQGYVRHIGDGRHVIV